MECNKGNHDVFVGIEHRLRGDKFAETLDKESKRYKITTNDSRATKEGEDVGMQISGGGFAAVANRLTSAAPVDGGKGDSSKKMKSELPKSGSNATREYMSFPCFSSIRKAGPCVMKNS